MIFDPSQAVSQILWIGGPPDAGKSTTAQRLADKYDLYYYHFDRYALPPEKLDRTTAPRAFEWFEKSPDELWQQRIPEEIAAHTLETYVQIFPAQLDDLLQRMEGKPAIAEGSLYLPELVEPYLADVRQAIWLFPTEAFKQESFRRRGKNQYSTRDNNSEPTLATRNFFERDRILSGHMMEGAQSRGLKTLEIDGLLSPDGVVELVESHFAPFLKQTSSHA